jgi:hypothetical protein
LISGTKQFVERAFPERIRKAAHVDHRGAFVCLTHHQRRSRGELICHAYLRNAQGKAKEVGLAA